MKTTTNLEDKIRMKKIVEFHTGRGGRFYNPGHLTFCGVGCEAKNSVENENFLGFENEAEIIEKYRDLFENSEDDCPEFDGLTDLGELLDLFTELDYDVNSDEYKAFSEKYGDPGKVILHYNGNYIGDYVPDGEEYHYDEDGYYNTTAGVLISGWDDLSEDEQDAINRSEIAYIYDLEFGDRPEAD